MNLHNLHNYDIKDLIHFVYKYIHLINLKINNKFYFNTNNFSWGEDDDIYLYADCIHSNKFCKLYKKTNRIKTEDEIIYIFKICDYIDEKDNLESLVKILKENRKQDLKKIVFHYDLKTVIKNNSTNDYGRCDDIPIIFPFDESIILNCNFTLEELAIACYKLKRNKFDVYHESFIEGKTTIYEDKIEVELQFDNKE